MRTTIRLAVLGAMLLPLVSCRALVLEDRLPCPRFMFFDLLNSELFDSYEDIRIAAYSYPEGLLLNTDTTSVRAVSLQEYYMPIRGQEAVMGYGVLGIRQNKLENDSQWIIPTGMESDPLFRFTYQVPTEQESFLVPVELVKDYAQVTVRFVGVESYTATGGQFPFDILITGNTRGIEVLTGTPIRGYFEFAPEETQIGIFHFRLPRQADHALRMELHGRPDIYEKSGLVQTIDLWAVLYEQGGVTWEEKNLPDMEVVIDYKEMEVAVRVSVWNQEDLNYQF